MCEGQELVKNKPSPFLFIQLAPQSARRHHYIVTSSVTHMWLSCCMCSDSLSQSMMSSSCLSACLLPSIHSVSGNVWERLNIQPHQPRWSRVMHGPKTLCFIRQQILAGQRWFPHVVFLTEKTESRCLSLERKLFLTSWPPPTLLNVTCVIKKSETCQATFKCWLRMAMGLTANAKLSIPSGLQLPENNVVTDVCEC